MADTLIPLINKVVANEADKASSGKARINVVAALMLAVPSFLSLSLSLIMGNPLLLIPEFCSGCSAAYPPGWRSNGRRRWSCAWAAIPGCGDPGFSG
jgi:hypothetical protein